MANITKIKLPSGDTYDIVDEKSGYITSDTLPIASASTLGAIKVGSGLNIDASTGVLSATGTSLTIDTAISTSSTNPVQNQAIGNALAYKVDTSFTGTNNGNSSIGYDSVDGTVVLSSSLGDDHSTIDTYNREVHLESSTDASNRGYSTLGLVQGGFVIDVSDSTITSSTHQNPIQLFPEETHIRYVVTPTNNTDAANKQYVDNSIPSNTSIETTGISIASHSTTSIYGVGSSTTTASKASGANSTVPSLTFAMDSTTTTQLNITWSAGSASTWSFSDVTVPIKNSSSTTVVTSATHSITDNGHSHDVGNYL